jgi:hypothetical protein
MCSYFERNLSQYGRQFVNRTLLKRVKACACRNANQAVLRIRDGCPGSLIQISIHPGSKNIKKEMGGKIGCPTFFMAILKNHKIETYFFCLKWRRKKF